MHREERTFLNFLKLSLSILLLGALASEPNLYAKDHQDQGSSVNIDEPGRIPYQAVARGDCSQFNCSASFNPVPAGHRLVLRQVSGELTTSVTAPDTTKVLGTIQNAPGSFLRFTAAPFAGFLAGVFDQAVEFYVDAGQVPEVDVDIVGVNPSSFRATLVGYLLDCSQAPCAPIAN